MEGSDKTKMDVHLGGGKVTGLVECRSPKLPRFLFFFFGSVWQPLYFMLRFFKSSFLSSIPFFFFFFHFSQSF